MNTKVEAYGKLYTGGDIKTDFLGLTSDGIDAIKYGETQDIEPVYAMGSREPQGYIEKECKYEASITVKAFVLDALERVAPNGKINAIKAFPIGVSYMDDNEQIIKHDKLISIRFKGTVREAKNDNNELVYELPLFIGGILRNQ